MNNVLTKILGSANDRAVRRLKPIVDKINIYFEQYSGLKAEEFSKFQQEIISNLSSEGGWESAYKVVEEMNQLAKERGAISDEELQRKTLEFKKRIKEKVGDVNLTEDPDDKERLTLEREILDEILPEAYAVVKETCRRLVGKSWMVTEQEWRWKDVPFDVQLMGAITLHQGKIAEMATGEGKTLVATMPLYLNSLVDRGAHLITVNDYLAKRDSEWMGSIYNFLQVEVGCIQEGMVPSERKPHYECAITYGTNNQFGFDYLRDNMVWKKDDKVQRGHCYVIVDEVDSVLIDEARTPLIISGPVEHVINREYGNLKPTVEKLVHRQTLFINQLISEAEKLREEGKENEAGKKLIIAQQGGPKNNRLLKLKKDSQILKLIEDTEKKLMSDEFAQRTGIRKEESEFHKLKEELYYLIDEKGNAINITEKGRNAIAPEDAGFWTLPDLSRELPEIDKNTTLSPREKFVAKQAVEREYAEISEKLHVINQLLKAYSLFAKDVEYVVQDNKVLIVDEFTGRLMPGRRYSDGLHQALEAKEGVRVEAETQTLATITLQNYFRMYKKLAGMTGTAMTEAKEFWDIYKLDVVSIPTNKPVKRLEYHDVVYKTRREKYDAVMTEIEEMHNLGRPVLVGTVSVDVSETIARMLKRKNIPHQVLNARYHQKEAEIVAFAGQKGRVTIATNMAGRGTDIKLGPGIADTGGLHIIGSERHESRRIDNQLRGRCARQGDPGSARFYLSLEDNLMRLFGSDRLSGAMERWGPKEGEPIEHRFITRALEGAQKRVELWHFDMRKRSLEYDDVLNFQRNAVYSLRDEVLQGLDLSKKVKEIIENILDGIIDSYTHNPYSEEWDWDGLFGEVRNLFLIDFNISIEDRANIKLDTLRENLHSIVFKLYSIREEQIGLDEFRELERQVLLHTLDRNWINHLLEIDALKEGIGLRGYAQRDPVVEYKRDSYRYFEEFLGKVNYEVTRNLFGLRFRKESEQRIISESSVKAFKPEGPMLDAVRKVGNPVGESPGSGGRTGGVGNVTTRPYEVPDEQVSVSTYKRGAGKVGRNEPCPCSSGKKYKNCCGRVV